MCFEVNADQPLLQVAPAAGAAAAQLDREAHDACVVLSESRVSSGGAGGALVPLLELLLHSWTAKHRTCALSRLG